MKYVGLLICLTISFNAQAQQFFSKIVAPKNQLSSGSYVLVNDVDNSVIVYCDGVCASNKDSLFSCSSLIKYDYLGNLVWEKKLLGVSRFIKALKYENNLVLLSKSQKFSDSLQLSVYNLVHENVESIHIPNQLSSTKDNLFNLFKYKDKYVVSIMGGFYSNYLQNGKQKLYPYLIWVNENLILDTIIKVDLPYGEIYQMSDDKDGNLNAMVTQMTIEKIANGNEVITENKGYVTFSENKEFIKSKLVKIDRSNNSLLLVESIQSLFLADGRKIFIAERFDIKNTEIHCWDKDDNLLWVNKEFWRDEFANRPWKLIQCKNGDFVHTGEAHRSGMSPCSYIHRISPDGSTKWIRYYGYKAPSTNQNSGLGNWLIDITENVDGTLTAVGVLRNSYIPHLTHPVINDSTWILRVDSMGCMEKDKCNDEYWWNGPEDWFQYDQLTLKHKEWNFQQKNSNGMVKNIQQRFGQDTTMYDKNLSALLNTGSAWARYKPVITKDVKTGDESQDSIYISWMKEGKVFGLASINCLQCRNHIMLYDFTLKLHDTFNLTYNFGRAIVTQVDSISLIPGYFRKRIILKHLDAINQSKYGDLVWIDGIGSPNGILYYNDWKQGTKTELTCYYDRGEKRYSSTDDPDCRKEVQVSEYQKVISQSHIWYTAHSSGWAPGTYYYRNKVSADSVSIGNHFYHQVLSSADSNGNIWSDTGKYVRESFGRLWILDSIFSNEEVLIMDMNLNKDDLFEYTDLFGQSNKFIINKIDTVVDLSGNSRKVVFLSCEKDMGITFRWIEGIGPDYGVFQPRFEQCAIDGSPIALTCFYSDNVQQWQSQDFSKCWINPLVTDTSDMDISTIWYSSSYTGNFADGDCGLKIDITKVVRDTTIEDRVCRIIGVFSEGKYLPESEIITFQKIGKLYFYEDNTWKLLYDFAAQVGDTVTYFISKKYPYYFKYNVPGFFEQNIMDRNPYQLLVENLDTIYTLEGRPLRRFYTKSLDVFQTNIMEIIIENVGSNLKFFGNSTIISPPECLLNYPSLRCYSDDEISIKFTEGECDKLTAIKYILDVKLNLYPNPGHDKMRIDLGSEAEMPISYKVTDFSGRILISGTQHPSSFELNTIQLRTGLFIITITDNAGKIWLGKWVKQ